LDLAHALGLPKIPMMFGFMIALKKPLLIPGTLAFVGLIYIIPITVVIRLPRLSPTAWQRRS
jgi:branched-chain amino acid transport system permease protein